MSRPALTYALHKQPLGMPFPALNKARTRVVLVGIGTAATIAIIMLLHVIEVYVALIYMLMNDPYLRP